MKGLKGLIRSLSKVTDSSETTVKESCTSQSVSDSRMSDDISYSWDEFIEKLSSSGNPEGYFPHTLIVGDTVYSLKLEQSTSEEVEDDSSREYTKEQLLKTPVKWISNLDLWEKAVNVATHNGERSVKVIIPIAVYKRLGGGKKEVTDSNYVDAYDMFLEVREVLPPETIFEEFVQWADYNTFKKFEEDMKKDYDLSEGEGLEEIPHSKLVESISQWLSADKLEEFSSDLIKLYDI